MLSHRWHSFAPKVGSKQGKGTEGIEDVRSDVPVPSNEMFAEQLDVSGNHGD